MKSFISNSPEESSKIASDFAGKLVKSDIVAFYGGMGAGKTHFIKGLCNALHFNGNVTSPTFNIVHEYKTPELALFHFDFYRLENFRELETIGFEEYLYGDGVCFIEWSEKVDQYLHGNIWKITLDVLGKTKRSITIEKTL